MASKPRRIGSAEPQTASTQVATGDVSVGNAAGSEEIRLRAYEIYLARGERPGFELDDWLQAEREIRGGAL